MSESRLNPQQRLLVKSRANGCCEYCLSQEEYSPDTFTIEHIVPLIKGGSNHLDNVANACQGCNNLKCVATEAIDSLTGRIVPLYHPRQHNWHDHFTWNEDYTLMIGLSPIGRATIDKLALNRRNVVNKRRLWRTFDPCQPQPELSAKLVASGNSSKPSVSAGCDGCTGHANDAPTS